MDIQPATTQPISDDQELAKVLAGVNTQTDTDSTDAQAVQAMSDVTAPSAPGAMPSTVTDPSQATAVDASVATPTETVELPADPQAVSTAPAATEPTGELASVKQDAINELRPLVDRLTLAPEEKFDTYLLLIRSTDDRSLVAPANEAAKAIPDETRKAQALLDIIKEIDFLSGQN